MCVWQQANATAAVDGGAKWWSYAHLFTANCHTDATWTPDCSYAAMRAAGVDDAAVRACVAASNSSAKACAEGSRAPICTVPNAAYTNWLLQAEMDLAADLGVWVLPSARVEDVLVVGGMQPRSVLGAICSAFQPAPGPGQVTAPPVCGCLLQPTDAALQACAAGAGGAPAAAAPAWAVALAVVGALGLAAAGAALWWVRRTRVELRAEMEQYMSLAEGPRVGGEEGGRAGAGAGAGARAAGGASSGGGWALPSFLAAPLAGVGSTGWTRVPAGVPAEGGGGLDSLPPGPEQSCN